jgi:two-component system, NtrC family, sensor kinase
VNLLRRLRTALDPAPRYVAVGTGAAILEQLPDGVLVLDRDDRILLANARAAALLGRPHARISGSRFRQMLVRADRDAHEARTCLAHGGAAQSYEVSATGGELGAFGTRILAVTAAPAPDPAAFPGLAIGCVLTLRDRTDERLAADELAHSESRYRHLFEGASDAIMTFDAFGRFTTVNDAGEAISGYTREELIGRFFGPLLAVEGLPKAILEFRRALSGVAGQFDSVIVHKDGKRRYITVNYACPQRSHEVLCVIRDATSEKQLQQQLIQSEKMAAIGQLVSGVAHELNNPLASISAFAQLQLMDAALAEDHRHSADVIRTEARRAARIVHNLLTFARQHKSEKSFANLNQVLQDTLELREYELTVRGIQLVRELDPAPLETMVDVYQIQQVLLNLVTNAEQAMHDTEHPQHRLVVRTRLLADTVRLEIEDTGPGIPPERQALIFNPFFTTKPTGQGTGLGLSISLGIVSEHNGRIWMENVPDGGTRFCIELPRIARSNAVAPPPPSAALSPAAGLCILVADDEQPIRTALQKFLTNAGHRVVAVSSGSEALWRCTGDERFDAVLLDIRMPDVSGTQIFERWQREQPALAKRVIFITGDIVSVDLQKFLEGSGRPYLAKPFELGDVLAVLPGAR